MTSAGPGTPAVPLTGVGSPLLEEIVAFQGECNERYRFNSRWDNSLNAGGILLSVCIITAGVYNRSDISTILGGLVGAMVTAQRAFPFGQRATFYRVLTGNARNLQTDMENGLLTSENAVNSLKALRLDYAQQLPIGATVQAPLPHGQQTR